MINTLKSQRFSHPILGGLISALLFSVLWRVVGDLATVISIVPMLVVGLMHRQLKDLLPALIISLLNVAFLLGLDQLLNYVLYVAAPGLIFPRLAMGFKQDDDGEKQWYPLERLIGGLGLYALGATLILAFIWHVMGGAPEAFKLIEGNFQKSPLEAQDRIQVILRYLKVIWPYVPGASMGVFMLMVAMGVSLTQKWFSHKKVTFPRPALKLSELYLPWWCWKAFAGFGTAWALSLQTEFVAIQHIFGNLTLPLVMLFLLQGLSIVVAYAKKQKNPKMFLVIFYGFVVVFGWTLLILILGGLLEPWLDLRTRLIQTKEKE